MLHSIQNTKNWGFGVSTCTRKRWASKILIRQSIVNKHEAKRVDSMWSKRGLRTKRSATLHLNLHLTLGLKFDFIAADSTADFDDLRLGGVGFGPKVAAVEIQC